MGVALSAIFLLWFSSGIVMMYWSFPEVSERDRRERAPVLNPAQIKVTPEEAYAALEMDQPARQAQITSFDGRPVYRFGGDGNAMVYADDGSVQTDADEPMLGRIASAWTGKPLGDATRESVEEVDQWTVGSNLRSLHPLYKYSFDDGQQVYVSGRSAEVEQYTTRESRFWAYLGPIPHWLYFTPLRKHSSEWFRVVVWSSAIGSVAALLGIVVGVWMLSPSKRYRYVGVPTSIPYRGWKRWHMILGLFFGIVTLTWAFSGLLSMGPFDFVERLAGNRAAGKPSGRGGFTPGRALRGDREFELSAYAAKSPGAAIASLGAAFQTKELEFSMFAGAPQYIATDAAGQTRIIPVQGEPRMAHDSGQIMSMVREAAGSSLAELRLMNQYDAYYLDRLRERPLPVIYVRLNDESGSRYYIDARTGETVGTYSSRSWVNRWLYHGLHSLDFPWLYNYRPLWDIVVITLMLGGTALCVTSLVLTYRVLERKFAAVVRVRINETTEDLAVEAEK
jgi:uncharacterized iron-regulated membrane protein